jgi:CHAD domain-containing protein
VIRLAHHLGVRRYRQAGKLHSTVKRDEAELRDRLRRVEHRLSEAIAAAAKPHQALDAGHGDSNDEPLLHMVAAALRLSQELAAVPRLGPKNLHSYRIEVKRLRYVLEMADEAGERQKKIVEELRNVQDRIGDWHDWVELHAIAEGLLQHDRCKLIAEIRRVEKQKFQQALKTTEQMRQRYLQLPPSGNKRAEHSRPSVPLPALAASAQIAA